MLNTASPNMESLQGQFLVSMPQLDDDRFKHGVVFICKHDDEGAIGVLINRLSKFLLADIFDQLEIACPSPQIMNTPVHYGGPVSPELGLLLHSPAGKWESSVVVADSVHVTSSVDILHHIAAGTGPARYLMTLGYSGWAPGQLEYELSQNAWFNAPLDMELLFASDIADRWQLAAQLIGVRPEQFSNQVGHA